MSIRLQFDSSKNVVLPTLVLAKRNGSKIANLPVTDLYVTDNFNSYSEFTCTVHKYDNGVEYPYWDEVRDFRCVYIPTWDLWFELQVTTKEDDAIEKSIICRALCESELSQIMLYDIEINTEDDILREDYIATVLYNPENTEGSLLNRILDKAPHYTIGHVDSTIANLQRTFKFNNNSILDAMYDIANEMNCIFIFDSGSDENGNPKRTINVYDLEAYCFECGYRDEFTGSCPKCGSTNIRHGYGNDTTIFVSVDNLAEEIEYETDVDSVKNCFKLEAGDDLMTAAIINANPNGSAYIWYITDEMREDMSSALRNKLAIYDSLYDMYVNDYELHVTGQIIRAYNLIVTKYLEYDDSLKTIPETITGYSQISSIYYDTVNLYYLLNNSLMPTASQSDTSAESQATLLTAANISPVAVQSISSASASTANSAVLAVAKLLIDKRYQVKVKTYSYSNGVWTGSFTVTNTSDEEDTADSNTISVTVNDDYETFVEQKIKKSLRTDSDQSGTDILSLLTLDEPQFSTELTNWSLTRLNSFYTSCQTVIDMLIDQGLSNDSAWENKTPNLYEEIYLPYYNKLLAIAAEISVREGEIKIITGEQNENGETVLTGVQTILNKEIKYIHDHLNFQSFIGEDLWLEFAAFRREDTYNNDNYISDGLTNTELLSMADDFLAEARKEIYKSATLQHSISASLRNLLAMPEFEPIVDHFEVGNWIRIRVDEKVYRLRLLSFAVDFENLENLKIEFSDVKQYKDGVTDSASIMAQAQSMTSSYGAVTRQANKGKKSNDTLTHWVDDGLALTNMKIVNRADNQNVTWDKNGILCREYLSNTDTYSDKQLKVINKGLYVTDNNWRTSKAGIGNFTFYNPKTGLEEEAYGVIAETLVGNLILSSEVGIYNTTGSVVIDEDGLSINSDMTEEDAVPMTFSIGRTYLDENDDEVFEQVAYLDSDGKLVLNGEILIYNSENDIDTINNLVEKDTIYAFIDESIGDASTNISGRATAYADELKDAILAELDNYKDEMSRIIRTSDAGLIISGINPSDSSVSPFMTVIDNEAIKFLANNLVTAYVSNNQLYIQNATIENTMRVGNFFIYPKSDNGLSIIWLDDSIANQIPSSGGSSGSSGSSSNIEFSGDITLEEMIEIAEDADSMKT